MHFTTVFVPSVKVGRKSKVRKMNMINVVQHAVRSASPRVVSCF